MYKLLFLFILSFSLTSVVIGEDCNDLTNNALRLKCDLLKDYDKTERPVKHHKESITIGISVHPVEIVLSDYDDKLSLKAWMFMNWTDQFLTWKPEDYQDLKKLKPSCSEIWVPDLMSLSILAEDPYQSASFMVCSVQSNGFVEMVYSTSYENYCVADRTYWPYDTHSCSLMLGSRQFLGPTLNFNLEEILPDYLKNDKVWNVKDIQPAVYQDRTGGHENETYTRLELKFTLERHASVKSVTFVFPGLGLAFITLAVLWLEVTSPERIYVLALIIYTDITYLDYFNYLFPASGPKAPMLVCFFRDSVAISGACVILTIISRLLLNTSWKPGWLSAFVRFIDEKSYIQSYLLINTESDINDTKEEVVDNESSFSLVHQRKKEWRIFVTFVDRLIFITFFLIYFIIVLKFFPVI